LNRVVRANAVARFGSDICFFKKEFAMIRKRTLALCAGLSCANVVMLFATTRAHADPVVPRFRIIDLGDLVDLDISSTARPAIAFGINDENQVVGMAQDENNEYKAFIWVPSDAYGLNGLNSEVNHTRMWSLGTLLSNNSETSVAYDINDDGWICGATDYNSSYPVNAFVWNPTATGYASDANERIIPMGTLEDAEDFSAAYAVNESLPLKLAGYSDDEDDPNYCDQAAETHHGFLSTIVTTETPPTVSLSVRHGSTGRGEARAFGIQAGTETIVGHVEFCNELGGGPCNVQDPVYWTAAGGSASISLKDLNGDTDLTNSGGSAYDINADGDICGFVREGTNCAEHEPVYWSSVSATPVELPQPSGAADNCAAYALNNTLVEGRPAIAGAKGQQTLDSIGTSFTADGALLWEWNASGDVWEVIDLNEAGTFQQECEGVWTKLEAALSINDDGVIVGYGLKTIGASSIRRAFMLIPFDCAEQCLVDLAPPCGDGRITIADVNAVVTAFNQSCDECPEDMVPLGSPTPENGCDVGDDAVSIADVVAVVVAYNSYCYGVVATPPSEPLFSLQAMDFSDGYPDENVDIQDFDEEVSNAWATFSSNYDVYRLWVTLENETDKLEYLGGDDVLDLALVISVKGGTFYNHGSGTNKAPSPALFETHPNVAFDTFITMGSATDGSSVTILGTLNLSANTLSTSTGWYKLGGVSPVSCGEDCWRVLVGQITVSEGAVIEGGAQLLGDGIDEYAEFSSDQ
jgi:probable HAF family extracellular repeat protein